MPSYTGRHIVVHYDEKVCTHSANCVKNLSGVFDITKKPWVNPDGAEVGKVMETIQGCPSGALTYELIQDGLSEGGEA